MNENDIDDVKRLLSPTFRRSQLSNGRGSIEVVSDYKSIQECQLTLLADEVREDIERLQEYGFTSNPPSGSDAAVIFLNGNRDHGIIIATDSRQYRPKNLNSGEVCIYDKNGSEILLKNSGEIEIKNPLGNSFVLDNTKMEISIGINKITLDSSGLKISINGVETTIDSTGLTSTSVSDSTGSMDDIRTIYNSHAHPYVDTPVGASVTSVTTQGM